MLRKRRLYYNRLLYQKGVLFSKRVITVPLRILQLRWCFTGATRVRTHYSRMENQSLSYSNVDDTTIVQDTPPGMTPRSFVDFESLASLKSDPCTEKNGALSRMQQEPPVP